ncbi:MAG: hypothetical protein HYU77_07005 [Betaproteobacteria bacterium]|nr:hypothetical protein [Betaproteobacteria bacterium]
MAIHRESVWKAVAYGTASIALYAVLFVYSDRFVEWAERTRDGEKLLFIIPIVVAFVFSYVHGAFTGYFWDALGFRAAKGSRKPGNK